MRRSFVRWMAAMVVLGVMVSGASATVFINIGTGSTGGTYYPVGAAMAKIWNEKIEDMKANAQSTGGTVNNLQLMTDNEAEAGFMDGAYYSAYTGTGKFEGKPMENLRALVPLYPEPVQLMVARQSGIKTLGEFKGKKVSIGAVASGTEVTARQLLKVAGMDPDKDITPENLGVGDTTGAFGDQRIDAAVMVGALGMAGVVEATTLGLVDFIDVPQDILEKVMKETPYWVPFTIPANYYKGQPNEVKTYASWNILGVKADLDEELAYRMTKALFENRADLVLVNSKMENMAPENVKFIMIPLHPGAEKYYKEIGAVK